MHTGSFSRNSLPFLRLIVHVMKLGNVWNLYDPKKPSPVPAFDGILFCKFLIARTAAFIGLDSEPEVLKSRK